MVQNESKAKRGPDGKFLPGHKPPKSPGRPRGPNGVKARASRIASERLEQMLGKAADVIDEALDEGDSHVATWLIDRVRPPRQSDFLRTGIESNLSTPREVVEAALEATVAAGSGEISLSEARAYIDLLARYGGMQGYLELEILKSRMEALKTPQRESKRVMDQSAIPEEHRLRWGQGTSLAQNEASIKP